uniref:G-protein coupled receptors family 1 profile domain-containing protein n=1 Tax=Latimeria chalumnae TaxID=7897 RepID=H3A4U6_LATCH
IMEQRNITAINGSTTEAQDCIVDTSYKYVFYQVIYSIIFIIGLGANCLAFKMWLQFSKITSTTVYMINLSIADLVFVISLPMRIYYYTFHKWPATEVFCRLTFTLKYISLYGSIFFLTCIGIDRYFAMVLPLTKKLRKVSTARFISVCMWCFILTLSISIPFLWSAPAPKPKPCSVDLSTKRNKLFIICILSLVEAAFILPLFVLLFSYCSVVKTLKRPSLIQRKAAAYKPMKIIYSGLCIFLICFSPYHFNLFWFTLSRTKIMQNCTLAQITQILHPIVLSIASMNCCLNPLIYYFSSYRF